MKLPENKRKNVMSFSRFLFISFFCLVFVLGCSMNDKIPIVKNDKARDAMQLCSAGISVGFKKGMFIELEKTSATANLGYSELMQYAYSALEMLPKEDRQEELNQYRKCLIEYLKPDDSAKYSTMLKNAYFTCINKLDGVDLKHLGPPHFYPISPEGLVDVRYFYENDQQEKLREITSFLNGYLVPLSAQIGLLTSPMLKDAENILKQMDYNRKKEYGEKYDSTTNEIMAQFGGFDQAGFVRSYRKNSVESALRRIVLNYNPPKKEDEYEEYHLKLLKQAHLEYCEKFNIV